MIDIRDPKVALIQGAMNRCPKCGEGKILRGYLHVVPQCASCGEPLGKYPSADGPAFFTITIVMLLLIPMIGFGWTLFGSDPFIFFLVLTVVTTAITLLLLRPIKSAFVAYLWAHEERDRGA
ncbi:MAG: DUF983 domain-containing protein [Paracoccus sp. (in: a-proteobacteria)]|uniref:DUF983 domain-containing protein n=1 Tax=Paracoccus sp. TaxID=267 RepID=UPI00391B66A5